MRESLSVRTYEPVRRTHAHNFHQIVIPLRGAIEISVGGLHGVVGAGHCVIISRDVEHSFDAKRQARFLVADLHELPPAAAVLDSPFATVSSAFKAFCLFVDVQLSSQQNHALEESMVAVFRQLLSLQDFQPEIDSRISRAMQYAEDNVAGDCTLETLASVSSLSASQFKVLFTKHAGMPLGKYIQKLRMEKARALLANTDMPILLIAEIAGYGDASAFTRRFQKYYGSSPREYRKQY